IRQNLLAGQPVAVSYRTVPDYQNFKLATGSNSFLVQNARVARFQEELKGKTARTAVGTSREGKDLYFVVVEKSPRSNGMEQKDLAVFLVRLGIEEAVNLDGGGSTTLAARRLGDQEPTLINQPKEGRERKIPDAIGIFNTAPPGEPKGLLIAGPDRVVAGTEAEFSVKGYDSHFHPWKPKNIQWVYPEGTAPKKENIYKNVFYIEGEGPREVLLSASAQGISTSKKVKVVRFADIRTLKVTPAEIAAKRGEAVSLSFQVVTEDGEAIPVDGRFVSCRATIGTVKDGIFEAGQQRGQGEITTAFGGREVKVPVKIECLFKDTVGSWAFEQIEDLAAAGLVKGYTDGTFQPARPVTRAEMTALLARVFNWPPSSREAGFRDEIPAWAKEAISSAAARGVIKGYPDGTFRPGNYITRAELCGILDRALSLKTTQTKPRFKDGDQIPAWAAESVERVAAAGLIRGYEDGTLRPEARVTRAEIAVILWRQLHGAS
ncbi:MAG: S-layer homology domain-containing protein, partial [Desulfotomaculales bacterium]